jgi:hypothetical protein
METSKRAHQDHGPVGIYRRGVKKENRATHTHIANKEKKKKDGSRTYQGFEKFFHSHVPSGCHHLDQRRGQSPFHPSLSAERLLGDRIGSCAGCVCVCVVCVVCVCCVCVCCVCVCVCVLAWQVASCPGHQCEPATDGRPNPSMQRVHRTHYIHTDTQTHTRTYTDTHTSIHTYIHTGIDTHTSDTNLAHTCQALYIAVSYVCMYEFISMW